MIGMGRGLGRRMGRAATLLASLALAAGAAMPAQAWAQGQIAGQVTDEITGAGLAAVYVEVLDGGQTVVAQATTGPGGAYRISGIAAGAYSVRFTSPGWETVMLAAQTVAPGQTTTVSSAMTPRAYQLNPITVTSSRTYEKALEAPAAVEVVSQRSIEERQVTSPVEHVEQQPGVNVSRTGIRGRTAVLRGFDNVFSSRTLFMTDNRIARVPSLRVNLFYATPTSELDVEKVETVLGPGSALYGPNATGGVIHFLTKSPIRSPGASFTVGGGLRQQGTEVGAGGSLDPRFAIEPSNAGLFQFDGRIAVAPSDKFGFKISGQYFDANEYVFNDAGETEPREDGQACVASGFNLFNEGCLAFAAGLDITSPADQEVLRQSAQNAGSGRDAKNQNWAVDARMDWEPQPGTSVVLSAGRNFLRNGTELTGIGAGNITNWAVSYGQARFRHRDLFAQVFYNFNQSEETFLLRSGRPLFDNSSLIVAQLQHQSRIGTAHRFIYGFDYLGTNPDSRGSINGQFEDDDQITELGGYVQWEWAMSPKLDLTAAFRVDNNSTFDETVFSPRAALVYKPDASSSLRFTFNRAFSTPSVTNQFLDISAGIVPIPDLPFFYDIRGTGSAGVGHAYMRQNGVPMHMSPFNVLLGGSAREFLPTTTEQLWQTVVALLSSDPALGALASLIPVPSADQVGVLALLLDLEAAGGNVPDGCVAPPFCEVIDLSQLADIEALRPTVSNTLEVGYKGLFGDRVSFGANAWLTRYDNFVSPLQLMSPHVFLNGPQLGAYLTEVFVGLVGVAFPDEETARLTAAGLAELGAQIPLGTVTPVSVGGRAASLVAGYRNAGGFDVMGGELGAGFLLGERFELTTSLSVITRNTFETEMQDALSHEVSLNTPTVRGTASLNYRNDEAGLNGGLRFRAQNGFPYNSGPWVGDLEAVTTLDANFGFRVPGYENLWFQLDISNVLDNAYQSIVGAPPVGRVMLARLRWDGGL